MSFLLFFSFSIHISSFFYHIFSSLLSYPPPRSVVFQVFTPSFSLPHSSFPHLCLAFRFASSSVILSFPLCDFFSLLLPFSFPHHSLQTHHLFLIFGILILRSPSRPKFSFLPSSQHSFPSSFSFIVFAIYDNLPFSLFPPLGFFSF